jgi:hypothetical protein
MAIGGLEPVLLAGSLLLINLSSTWFSVRREIGAYVAFTALGIYAIGTIWNYGLLLYQKWNHDRHT